MKKAHFFKKGFTLIELLLVVTIIIILALVVFVGLKPAERLAQARDARRSSDVNEILTGIHECIIDDDNSSISDCIGSYTAGETYEIASASAGCDDVCSNVTSDTHCLDLGSTLDDYFYKMPVDPSGVATGHTEYTVTVNSKGLVLVQSCSAETTAIETAR